MNDKEIATILRGQLEVSCFANLNFGEMFEHSVFCKARLDCVPHFADCIVDIKTCHDASDLDKLAWDCFKYGYHRQASHYLDMFNATLENTEGERDLFMFIFVECEPPFGVRKIMLTDEFIEAGKKEREELMLLYVQCVNSDKWPLYPDKVSVLELPKRNINRYVSETL